jgi:uncharacterized YigZ family protein
MDSGRYPIPAAEVRFEAVIERSRFITQLARASSTDHVQRFIARVREEYPDATHHCWAFALGPPGSTAQIGMSDDGEPHGTAGRPMLQVLLHGGVGEVVAVVTRFYGGVKLGKGGLGRAYSGGVREALARLSLEERVQRVPRTLDVEYPALEGIRRLIRDLDGETVEEEFGARVRIKTRIPASDVATFEARVAEFRSCGIVSEA